MRSHFHLAWVYQVYHAITYCCLLSPAVTCFQAKWPCDRCVMLRDVAHVKPMYLTCESHAAGHAIKRRFRILAQFPEKWLNMNIKVLYLHVYFIWWGLDQSPRPCFLTGIPFVLVMIAVGLSLDLCPDFQVAATNQLFFKDARAVAREVKTTKFLEQLIMPFVFATLFD